MFIKININTSVKKENNSYTENTFYMKQAVYDRKQNLYSYFLSQLIGGYGEYRDVTIKKNISIR